MSQKDYEKQITQLRRRINQLEKAADLNACLFLRRLDVIPAAEGPKKLIQSTIVEAVRIARTGTGVEAATCAAWLLGGVPDSPIPARKCVEFLGYDYDTYLEKNGLKLLAQGMASLTVDVT